MASAMNILVILLEIPGFYRSISDRKWEIFAYYTQLSNICALLSSVFYVMQGEGTFTCAFRYLSSCMLTMTFVITVFVLIPMGAGVKRMMFSGNGLFHHLLCPVLSTGSYLLLEEPVRDCRMLAVPVFVTLFYGVFMMILNGLDRYQGPYPFFRVRHQSYMATFLWTAALMIIILVLSLGIMVCSARI